VTLATNLQGRVVVPSLQDIQKRWLGRMVGTSAPLVERMVLFLHDHWATAYTPGNTVDTPELETQNRLFRSYAFGNWRDLCHKMIEDVALSCFLNNNVNVKKEPNENLAREFMELFTLGPGNYTETDIRQAARALTGYKVATNFTGTNLLAETTGSRNVMVFDPKQHDDADDITILGVGPKAFMPHDFVDVVLAQPAAPRFLARKLAETFVAPNPSAAYIDRIAGVLRSSNWSLAAALRAIFNSPEFQAPAARSAIVKTPAEFVVGCLRALDKTGDDDYTIALSWMTEAGMQLYDPPNVGGWPVNMGWLGAGGVLARYNAGVTLADRHVNSAPLLPTQQRLRATSPQGWGKLFGLTTLAPATVDAMNGYVAGAGTAGTQVIDAAMITLLVASPDYNLS